METFVAALGILLIPVLLLMFLPTFIAFVRGTHRFGALAFNLIAFPLLFVPIFAAISWLIALIFACTGGTPTRTEIVIVRDTRESSDSSTPREARPGVLPSNVND